jgi:maleamate amidohydrolase
MSSPLSMAHPVKEWLRLIPEEDRRTYERAGLGGETRFGANFALIVVDVTYGFTGDRGQSLEDAIKKYKTACGPVAWETMPRIRKLIDFSRERGRPVIYTRSSPNNTPYAGRATKAVNLDASISDFDNTIPDDIAPREGEWVLEKNRASAFFQTPLASYLVKEGVNAVLVCGVSTSGCVRATVVDSFSHGFDTVVVEDCCFDRSAFSHCTNLFDMNAKYATALSLEEVKSAI